MLRDVTLGDLLLKHTVGCPPINYEISSCPWIDEYMKREGIDCVSTFITNLYATVNGQMMPLYWKFDEMLIVTVGHSKQGATTIR